ncbi:hypothetical protein [Mastigocoleus sp. MO_188.B34]|nr:hypothetical protein [Mastigocoleus sp. MO_188.B34]MDJ0694546.1 hypothetical protein [Mastigocoleus sp. MO_188.B34]
MVSLFWMGVLLGLKKARLVLSLSKKGPCASGAEGALRERLYE